MSDEDDAAAIRRAKSRKGGHALWAGMTPDERSEVMRQRSLARWAKHRAEHGEPKETAATWVPDDSLPSRLDEVIREHPDWTLTRCRREATARARRAQADLAYEALKARRSGA